MLNQEEAGKSCRPSITQAGRSPTVDAPCYQEHGQVADSPMDAEGSLCCQSPQNKPCNRSMVERSNLESSSAQIHQPPHLNSGLPECWRVLRETDGEQHPRAAGE